MRDKSVNPAEQKGTVKTRLRTGLLIFLCLLMLLTAGAIFYSYKASVTEAGIEKIIEEGGGVVGRSTVKQIGDSIVAVYPAEDGAVHYAAFEKLPLIKRYGIEMQEPLDQEDHIVLAGGWHAYIVKITEESISQEGFEKWQGRRTEQLMGFLISVGCTVLLILVLWAVRKRS
ncbi:hypothetical protein NE619_15895 [Anaerovorax odorimutans]|uniref:DUF3592 domain-containing protein n=1 Tax=Anaerovorax odorimutans TaxID=109327 RepID=A0ABT1RTQ0_9FIRM|nr:hypothetical protein [Anaerovorax odorimutans]MCQ4638216.1 hypothetical protein [Anaerovorax odorimutans]